MHASPLLAQGLHMCMPVRHSCGPIPLSPTPSQAAKPQRLGIAALEKPEIRNSTLSDALCCSHFKGTKVRTHLSASFLIVIIKLAFLDLLSITTLSITPLALCFMGLLITSVFL